MSEVFLKLDRPASLRDLDQAAQVVRAPTVANGEARLRLTFVDAPGRSHSQAPHAYEGSPEALAAREDRLWEELDAVASRLASELVQVHASRHAHAARQEKATR